MKIFNILLYLGCINCAVWGALYVYGGINNYFNYGTDIAVLVISLIGLSFFLPGIAVIGNHISK